MAAIQGDHLISESDCWVWQSNVKFLLIIATVPSLGGIKPILNQSPPFSVIVQISVLLHINLEYQ